MSGASTTYTRPVIAPRSDMDRKARGKPDNKARSGNPHNTTTQTLPSFRELLPPHLHEAIDASQYDGSPPVRRPAGSSPKYPGSMALARSGGSQTQAFDTHMSATPQGFDEYAGQYQTSPPHQHAPLGTSNNQGMNANADSMYRAHSSQQTSPSLPPFREFQSFSDRAVTDEGRYISPSSQYPSGYAQASDSDRLSLLTRGQALPQISPTPSHVYGSTGSQDGQRGAYAGQFTDMDDTQHMNGGAGSPNFGVMGSDLDARNKRRRGNLPKPVTDILRTWFHEHLDHPYPSEEDKQMFIARTGLTMSQISNWFINARRRQLPALRNQVRAQDNDRLNFDASMSDFDQPDLHESSMSPRSR